MTEFGGVAQPFHRGLPCSLLFALAAKEEHRTLDVLLPRREPGVHRQLLELVGVGGVEEQPAPAEPRPPGHAAQRGVGDHDVAPELAARLEYAMELAHGGVLVWEHVKTV